MNNHIAAELGPVLQDILYGEPRGAFDDPVGQSLLRIYHYGVGDGLTDKMVRDIVHPLKVQELFGKLPPFLKTRFRKGQIRVLDLNDNWIAFTLDSCAKHLLIAGTTGAGKSALTTNLGLQMAFCNKMGFRKVIPWFIEFFKRQFRQMVPLFTLLGLALVVVGKETLKLNPLQAGPCDLRAHLAMITDQLVSVLELMGERSRSIVSQALNDLYGKYGNWGGSQEQWPVMSDVYEWIWERSALNAAARQGILDRLAALIPGMGRQYRLAWNPLDLTNYSLVWELLGLPEKVKQLIVGPVLFSVMQYEYERGAFNLPFHHCIFCDDSQWLLTRRENGEYSRVVELAELIRGCGRSLAFNVQTLDNVPRRLLANCNARIAGMLNTHADWATFGADMGMNLAQIQWAKLNLRPGWFIGQLADSDWRHPFAFRIHEPKIPKVVSDQDAAATVQALAHLRVVPAGEYDRWQPHHLVDLSGTAASGTSVLTDTELRYVRAVMAQPGQPSRSYARAAGLSGTEAKAIRERLVRAGFLREHSVVTGKRGRAAKILEPLAPAKEAVAQAAERSDA